MYQLVSEYLKSEGAKYDLMNPTIRSEAHYEGTKNDPVKSIGNPIKLAPEIFGGDAYYSLPNDVYSYAYILFSMFSNTIEFDKSKPISTH